MYLLYHLFRLLVAKRLTKKNKAVTVISWHATYVAVLIANQRNILNYFLLPVNYIKDRDGKLTAISISLPPDILLSKFCSFTYPTSQVLVKQLNIKEAVQIKPSKFKFTRNIDNIFC